MGNLRLSQGVAVLVSLVFGTIAAGSSRADLIAAYDHPTASSGMDIAVVDLSTGSQLAVPGAVNGPGNETHPELSGDGSILVFQRGSQIIRYDRRHSTSVTIAPSLGAPDGFTTPGASPDGTRVIYGGGTFENGTEVRNDGARALVSVTSTLEGPILPIPSFGPNDPLTSCNPDAIQGYPGRGTADASIDNGDEPLMAWSTSVGPLWQLEAVRFSGPHFTGCLHGVYLPGGENALGANARFGAVSYSVGVPGPQRYAEWIGVDVPDSSNSFYPSGPASDPAFINTPLFQRSPSWSADGRYLGFSRTDPATGREVIEVYDENSQRLVNPSGFNITPADTDPAQGHISIALDPTVFHLVCTRVNAFNQICTQSSAGPTGALIMRIVGEHRMPAVRNGELRVRTVPQLRQVGVVVLGRKPRHFRVRLRDLRLHGKPLARGHYLIFIRARTKNLELVRDISNAIPFSVR